MTAAAVYLRVSTDRCRFCRRKRHAPDLKCKRFEPEQEEVNQQPECERLCRARGWEPIWFTEKESGAAERPEWRRVLEAARRGEVVAVVFWAIDRTGRTMVQVAHDLSELFRWSVHVASVQDSWLDVGPGPARDLLVQVMAWVAQGERSRLIERTKAGQARARAAGKVIGRPRGMTDAALARAAELRRSVSGRNGQPVTMSWKQIAAQLKGEGLGDFKRGTVQSAVAAVGKGG